MFPAALVLLAFGKLSWRALVAQRETFEVGLISPNSDFDDSCLVRSTSSLAFELDSDVIVLTSGRLDATATFANFSLTTFSPTTDSIAFNQSKMLGNNFVPEDILVTDPAPSPSPTLAPTTLHRLSEPGNSPYATNFDSFPDLLEASEDQMVLDEEQVDADADAYSDNRGVRGSNYILIADIDVSNVVQGEIKGEAGICCDCSELGYHYDTIVSSHNCTQRYIPGQRWWVPSLEMVALLFRVILDIEFEEQNR